MSYPRNPNYPHIIVNLVYNAVLTDAYSIKLVVSYEFSYSTRSGILTKPIHCFGNSTFDISGQRPKLSGRRGQEVNCIFIHIATLTVSFQL